MEMAGEEPDVIVGCVGGGSNFAGLAYPFMAQKLARRAELRFIARRAGRVPDLTKGTFAYDYGDTAKIAPIVPMYTLGSRLRARAGACGRPALPRRWRRCRCWSARATWRRGRTRRTRSSAPALQFAQSRGSSRRPSRRTRSGARSTRRSRREAGEERVILFNLCGHGHFDMQAYNDYAAGKLVDHAYAEDEVALALAGLPSVAA